MPGFLSLAAALLVAAMSPTHRDAGSGTEASAGLSTRLEILVVERPDCAYCALFRREVLPAYQASPRSREAPIRFIDVRVLTRSSLDLARPIDVIPTAVLLRDGKEMGRIPGYVGRENFFHSINYLLARRR